MSMLYGPLPGISNHYGSPGLGMLGSVIRGTTGPGAGPNGAGYLYNDWEPGDDAKEFRGLIVTPPTSGTFTAYEDGSFSFVGAPDGAYSFTYRLYVDGSDLGLTTATITIGAGNPVLAVAIAGVAAFTVAATGSVAASSTAVGSVLIEDLQSILATLSTGGAWYGVCTASPVPTEYIVWLRVASSPNVSLLGQSTLQNTRVQIDIYASTVARATAIEQTLETAMAYSGITNVPLSSQDGYEPDTRLFRVIKDYSLWAKN